MKEPSKAVKADTLKNMCDFWLPMSNLGYVNASPIFVGLMGVMSSTLAALPLIDVQYKL